MTFVRCVPLPTFAIVNYLSLIELKIRAKRRVTLVANDKLTFLNNQTSVIIEILALRNVLTIYFRSESYLLARHLAYKSLPIALISMPN